MFKGGEGGVNHSLVLVVRRQCCSTINLFCNNHPVRTQHHHQSSRPADRADWLHQIWDPIADLRRRGEANDSLGFDWWDLRQASSGCECDTLQTIRWETESRTGSSAPHVPRTPNRPTTTHLYSWWGWGEDQPSDSGSVALSYVLYRTLLFPSLTSSLSRTHLAHPDDGFIFKTEILCNPVHKI